MQIIRAGAVDHAQAAQRLADQAAVAETTDTHHAVDPFLDQIDRTVAGAEKQLNFGVLQKKVR
ncbi:hypothetical protein D3C79_1041110 [compost metagenome]